MENQENNKPLSEEKKHPKPTENIQLEIETVTPDTEKHFKPSPKTEADLKEEPKLGSEKENDTGQEDKKESE